LMANGGAPGRAGSLHQQRGTVAATAAWFAPLREHVVRATMAVQRSQERAASLNGDATASLLANVEQLVNRLTQLTATLAGRQFAAIDEEDDA